MKFEDAVNEKKCLWATSEDHSEFCGKDRMNRNYCEEHQSKAYQKGSKKASRGEAIIPQWPSANGNKAALRARGIK